MIKLKHLRHPVRTMRVARDLAGARLEMRRIAKQSERRFRGDRRYNLAAVTQGFSSHIDNTFDDTALLGRICRAYRLSIEQQKSASRVYDASDWWQEVRQRSLRPVMDALVSRDLTALRSMYRNFFRDPCSTGLISVPYGMTGTYFGGTLTNIHRRYYLGDVLHSVEYWRTQTSDRFALQELASPRIGNPFGAIIEDTLVDSGAPYRHYCAQKIRQLVPGAKATVAEVGGAFGGTAYYLLRDRPNLKYIMFDVPESTALTSYYLMRAFPDCTFLLYGEETLTEASIAKADVLLLPLFELSRMPQRVAQVSFTSHSMSDVSRDAFAEYLKHIANLTTEYFLYTGVERIGEPPSQSMIEHHSCFRLAETRVSGWHKHRDSGAIEVECLYDINAVEAERERVVPASTARR